MFLNTCKRSVPGVQAVFFLVKTFSTWCSNSVLPINTKVFNITEHVQGVQYLLQFWRSDGVLNFNTHFYSKLRCNSTQFVMYYKLRNYYKLQRNSA